MELFSIRIQRTFQLVSTSINLAKKNINHLRQTNYLINNNIFIEYNTQPIIYCAKKKQDKILLIIILAL